MAQLIFKQVYQATKPMIFWESMYFTLFYFLFYLQYLYFDIIQTIRKVARMYEKQQYTCYLGSSVVKNVLNLIFVENSCVSNRRCRHISSVQDLKI